MNTVLTFIDVMVICVIHSKVHSLSSGICGPGHIHVQVTHTPGSYTGRSIRLALASVVVDRFVQLHGFSVRCIYWHLNLSVVDGTGSMQLEVVLF